MTVDYDLPLASRLSERAVRGRPALELYIQPCILTPAHPWHPPPKDKPLRIQIEGPAISIERLFPEVPWRLGHQRPPFPQPPGPWLAELTYRMLYGEKPLVQVVSSTAPFEIKSWDEAGLRPVEGTDKPDIAPDCLVRDEYVGSVRNETRSLELDYYGVTFDHLVPLDDRDPEVLQINMLEIEYDGGDFASKCKFTFPIEVNDYIGKKILALPRCCQPRKGTTDRIRVNESVEIREGRLSPLHGPIEDMFGKNGEQLYYLAPYGDIIVHSEAAPWQLKSGEADCVDCRE